MKTKEQKRKDAIFRNGKWANMTDRERLAHLDKHFPNWGEAAAGQDPRAPRRIG